MRGTNEAAFMNERRERGEGPCCDCNQKIQLGAMHIAWAESTRIRCMDCARALRTVQTAE